MVGHYSPTIARFGQKIKYLKKFAIMWQIYWGNNTPICEDWDNNRKIIYSNLRRLE